MTNTRYTCVYMYMYMYIYTTCILLPVVVLLLNRVKQDQIQRVRDTRSLSDQAQRRRPVSCSLCEYGVSPVDRSRPVYQCQSRGRNGRNVSGHCQCCGQEKGCGQKMYLLCMNIISMVQRFYM